MSAQNKGMDAKQCRRDNVAYLLRKHGSQTKLGILTETPASYFSQVVNGTRNLGDGVARRIENKLTLPRGWLDQPHDHNTGAAYQARNTERRYPLISWVAASKMLGSPDNYSPGDAEDWIPGDSRKLGERSFCLRVEGDSMTSQAGTSFPSGCIIYVDPDTEAVNGSFVVAREHSTGETTFKQLVIDGGRKYLKPLNPQFPSIPCTDEMSVCGVVKGASFWL